MLESNLSSYDWWDKLKAKIDGATLKLENQVVIVSGLGKNAAYLEDRYTNYLKRALQISKDIQSVVIVVVVINQFPKIESQFSYDGRQNDSKSSQEGKTGRSRATPKKRVIIWY